MKVCVIDEWLDSDLLDKITNGAVKIDCVGSGEVSLDFPAISHGTDEGMLGKDIVILIWSVVTLTILVILNQIIEMAQTRLFATIHIKSYYTIYYQLLRLKKTYFEDKNNSEILSYLQMDVSQVASVTNRYSK